MLGKAARTGIWLGASAIALAYAAAFLSQNAARVGGWLMGAGITLLVVSLLALGARSQNRSRAGLLGLALVLVGLTLGGGFAAALTLNPEGPGAPLLFGLPRRAAVLLYGIGLLPAAVVPIVYAVAFDRAVLTRAGLERLRADLARVRDGESGGAGPE